jgi:hypothetical protein
MRKLFVLVLLLIIAGYFYWYPSNELKVNQSKGAEGIELLPSARRGPCEPIYIKSIGGQTVTIVAIHQVSPTGMTFSPMPKEPLIGSNELEIITTSWENVQIQSLTAYRDLWSAYNDAKSGRTVSLRIGPHFYDLRDSIETIIRRIPYANFRNGDGRETRVSMAEINRSSYQSRVGNATRWYVSGRHKQDILELLNQVTNELRYIIYRRDTILLQNRIDSAYRLVRNIPTKHDIINHSMVIAFSDIVEFYENLDVHK